MPGAFWSVDLDICSHDLRVSQLACCARSLKINSSIVSIFMHIRKAAIVVNNQLSQLLLM